MKRILPFLVIFLLTHCAKEIKNNPPTGLKLETFVKEQVHRRDYFKQSTGKFWFEYQGSPHIRGRGLYVANLPGQVRMELRDPLGRLHLILALNGDQFVAYLPQEKKAYLDSKKGALFLKKWIRWEVPMDKFLPLGLGSLPKETRLTGWKWDGVKSVYLSESKTPDALSLSVEGEEAILTQVGFKNPAFSVNYVDAQKCCSRTGIGDDKFWFARTVKVGEKSGNQFDPILDIEWGEMNSWTPPEGSKPFEIKLPPGTDTETLKDE